ncbi:gastrin-releasing peptide receptor-like [Acanthaster planci]|uniref:Gastrin-releasing peptide receptor-like n=1 Tax=Acanthaster planci TaxID=133434 RepID=A0A8B7ZCI2_ACAPL|nr:gastrin-releasing peptide receptor-like [Acanthaster planci]XP_022100898.1 gastrin-releasing peptide receptor-like [Acanthaster planci]XP_022100900.1 gastrin-releasing peptide receptor-like [Acanthaster planci]XP_022100901.1 gastrin-releasing peptide receptor-like [Acanthaster planci]
MIVRPNRLIEIADMEIPPNHTLYNTSDDSTPTIVIIDFLIKLIGIIGNSSVILIIIGFRDMRNIPNLQIMSMAIGDLVYLVIQVPNSIAFNFVKVWTFGEAYCRIFLASTSISQGISVLTLAALSADRYYAIARPMARRKINVTQYTLITVVVIWSVSVLAAIPAFVEAIYHPFCQIPRYTVIYKVFIILQAVCLYVLPLTLIALFYALTAHTLCRGGERIGHKVRDGNGRRDPHFKARRRLAIIILVAVVCFAVCWLPHHVYTLWSEFEVHMEVFITPFMLGFMDMTYLMVSLSSCLNPLILYVMSSNYRRHFKRMFLSWCRCCRDKNQPLGHTWTLLTAFKTAVPNSRRSSMEFQMKQSSSTLVSHS